MLAVFEELPPVSCSLACFSRPGSHLFRTEGTYWKAASGAAAPERPSAAVAASAASLAWETVTQRKEGNQRSAQTRAGLQHALKPCAGPRPVRGHGPSAKPGGHLGIT